MVLDRIKKVNDIKQLNEEELEELQEEIRDFLVENIAKTGGHLASNLGDVYRKVIYMKAPEYATLVACKDLVERKIKNNSAFSNVSVQFDFNPTSGF